jgi:hypothetical protein
MWPVVASRHMMSATPLWSKSPTPTATEPAGCEPTSKLPAHWPFSISQTSMLLVAGLYQATSLVPSPLKSPAPSACHPAGCEPTLLLPAH